MRWNRYRVVFVFIMGANPPKRCERAIILDAFTADDAIAQVKTREGRTGEVQVISVAPESFTFGDHPAYTYDPVVKPI